MISQDPKEWTILIVDDEPDNLGVARKVLQFNGAEVHIARNGLEGLSVLENITPSFVLLDLSMPEMDGWAMFKSIRSKNNFQQMPIIALTAHAMSGDKERVLEAGFDGYIAKPFRIQSLLEEISYWLTDFNNKRV